MAEKIRLDSCVFSKGLTESREKARAVIMSGSVYVNGRKADKPGEQVTDGDIIEVRGNPLKYVSRGGLKLEKAINEFAIDIRGGICADIGASTGGFTDCILQNGAARVYAVDVGYGQLDWRLRNDSRVVVLERTNFRYIQKSQIPDMLTFASVDVSFISLTKILPVLRPLLRAGGEVVCLVKPQFEAGKDKVGKKGVVKDPAVHFEVIKNIVEFSVTIGFSALNLTFSPVPGPEGNIEYLLYLLNDGKGIQNSAVDISRTVKLSHEI